MLHGMSSDAELLRSLQQGDERAWDEAFRRLYPCAIAAARHPSAALTPSEAEDIAIAALTQLVPRIHDVESWDHLRALAVTISTRRAISERRRKLADKRGQDRVESLDHLREEEQGGFEPAEPVLARLTPLEIAELSALLREAMAEIDPTTCKLIHEFILANVPYKELSERHGIPIGTVGVNLARGLKKIRAKIEKNPRLLQELLPYLRT